MFLKKKQKTLQYSNNIIYVSKYKIHLKIIQSINIEPIKLSFQHTLSL